MIILKKCDISMERVVASESYPKISRYESVFVELSGDRAEGVQDEYKVGRHDKYCSQCRKRVAQNCQAEKALSSFRLPFLAGCPRYHSKFAFFQYYEVETDGKVKNTCDDELGCVRLRWAQTEQGELYFDLLQIACIPEKV